MRTTHKPFTRKLHTLNVALGYEYLTDEETQKRKELMPATYDIDKLREAAINFLTSQIKIVENLAKAYVRREDID